MLTGAGQQPQDGILSAAKRSFSYRGAMACNQLSNQSRGMEDLTSFKLAISQDITFYLIFIHDLFFLIILYLNKSCLRKTR